jgi:hypothetical protein
MVTTDVGKQIKFNVDITRLHDGSVLVGITRQDGKLKSYRFPERKVRLFSALDGPVKDAVEFLLGEAK